MHHLKKKKITVTGYTYLTIKQEDLLALGGEEKLSVH